MANGRALGRRNDLDEPGFTFDDKTRVLRIRHDGASDISIEGSGGNAPPLYVTFDDPHLAAGTPLNGQYPSGVIDWGSGEWCIHVPDGTFGTFNLALVDANAETAKFRFYWPRVFVGVDVYNVGPADATLTVHSPEIREQSFTIKPGELRRLRTRWTDPSSSVIFDLKNGEGLRFDNLAYLPD
jgi:hypothetical protein